MPYTRLHLTDINEFLITGILKYKKPVEIDIEAFTFDGFINIDLHKSDKNFDNHGIDFDLQECECAGLNEYENLSEYHGKTLYMCSAFEFLEYLSGCTERVKLLINVEDGTWVIKLLNFS